jgi:hypothetical protein
MLIIENIRDFHDHAAHDALFAFFGFPLLSASVG